MNRRRTVKAHLSFGSVLLLVAAAVIVASAGVFHAYIKNRQINVSREMQRAEDRISQHDLDLRTTQMLLGELENRFLLRDRLREFNSDLRPIPVGVVRELEVDRRDPRAATAGSEVAGLEPNPTSPDSFAVAGGP